MHELVFRNKWVALIWALSMLGTAAMFAGEDGAQKVVAEATHGTAQSPQNAVEPPVTAPADESLVEETDEFSEDEAADPEAEASPRVKRQPALQEPATEN